MTKKQTETFDQNLNEQSPAEQLSSLVDSQNTTQNTTEIQAQINHLETRMTTIEKAVILMMKQQVRPAEVVPGIEIPKFAGKKPEAPPIWQQKQTEEQKPPEKKKKISTWKIVLLILGIAILLYIFSNWSAIMSYFG